MKLVHAIASALFVTVLLAACGAADEPAAPAAPPGAQPSSVLVAESFLADITRNVAGERLAVETLIPLGADPHSFEPSPADVRKVADASLMIVNGAGFEAFLEPLLRNAGGERTVIEAAAGLTPRAPQPGEHEEEEADHGHEEGDPHFWLDPNHAIVYVENIRDGLSAADPAGKDTYAANADAYVAQLRELDAWIKAQVQTVPENRRLLVTNHESFGYFADRYGFRVVGAVIPSVSTAASPSAQQLAQLVDEIKATGAPAVFLELGANPQLAAQLAAETGMKVVTGLLTHSTTAADGVAPDYLSMMRYNVTTFVDALRQESS